MQARVEFGEVIGTVSICGVFLTVIWKIFFKQRRVRLYQVVTAVLMQGFMLTLAQQLTSPPLTTDAFLEYALASFLFVCLSLGIALNAMSIPGSPTGWLYFLTIFSVPLFAAPLLMLSICLLAGLYPQDSLAMGMVLLAVLAAPFAASGLKALGLWKPS